MYRKERREAAEIIRRFLKGEVGDEVLTALMDRLDLRSIPHVFETLEIGAEEMKGLSLVNEDLARPLREFLDGRLSLGSLKSRVLRISQIVNASDGDACLLPGPELAEGLNLLSLVLDPAAPLSARRIPTYLAPILESLDGRSPIPFRPVVEMVLRELGSLHFTSLCLAEPETSRGGGDGRQLPWSDLALLYGPPLGCDPRGDEIPEANLAPIWFIPLSVTTRRFYRDGLPEKLGEAPETEDGWMHPRNCRMAGLRARHPGLRLQDSRDPLFLVDPHGFSEIILEVEELTQEAVAHAIRLFALENEATAATLEGGQVELFGRSC